MSRVVQLFKHKWNPPADPADNPDARFNGKTVLITGANSGLGLEAAAKFVELGAAKVIVTTRDAVKGEIARKQIEQRTKRRGVVQAWTLEMTDYDSVRAFIDRTEKELDRVDVAVLNAGISNPTFEASPYEWEETLQVNALSTVYLGLLLMPKLRSTAIATRENAPVLEFVSSGTHSRAEFDSLERDESEGILQAMNKPENYNGRKQYACSKLVMQMGMLGIADLAAQQGEPQVVVTSVCPGPTKSRLTRKHVVGLLMSFLLKLIFFLFIRTTENGARTLVSGTTLGARAHGKFWQHDRLLESARQIEPSKRALLQKQVWFELLDALRKDLPEIVDTLQTIVDS